MEVLLWYIWTLLNQTLPPLEKASEAHGHYFSLKKLCPFFFLKKKEEEKRKGERGRTLLYCPEKSHTLQRSGLEASPGPGPARSLGPG